MEDMVHSPLICSTSILQAESHNHVLEQTHGSRHSERSLVYIFGGHEDLIISCITIHKTQNLVAGGSVDQCLCNGHRVFIFWSGPIKIPEVHAHPPSAIFLLYGHDARNPFGVPASPNKSGFQHFFYFFLHLDQNFCFHLSCSLLERSKPTLEGKPMLYYFPI
ncbi:hypothetical protein PAHAL_4G093100 [Panicum hallii]|uniref:Uncharacterized protein n=1 Tax=Panicum hallii TaxID=206008 RepID=A0A2S3HJW4_9POAL|nr:hypothetical protein PAHAL_4G093100 [Panicum hallii]